MKYVGTNLKEVLEAHQRFVKRECGWTVNDRAEFVYANLRFADFSGMNLSGAIFRCAILTGAHFENAILDGVDFRNACLNHAQLDNASLNNTNFQGAVLRDVSMVGSCLESAHMFGVDLTYAVLRDANLAYADLRNACLDHANFNGADMHFCALEGVKSISVDLVGAKNIPYIPMACPDCGSFIGWKKARSKEGLPCIVKILIPEDAKRSSANGRKCRCDKAVVLDIQALDGTTGYCGTAVSMWDDEFEYHIGDTITPRYPFEEDRFEECASGIHFFINRQEAVDY